LGELKNLLPSGDGWFPNSLQHEPHHLPEFTEHEALEHLFLAMCCVSSNAQSEENREMPPVSATLITSIFTRSQTSTFDMQRQECTLHS
jgi:hypothetical protein